MAGRSLKDKLKLEIDSDLVIIGLQEIVDLNISTVYKEKNEELKN